MGIIQKNIQLAAFTSLALGGPAAHFLRCENTTDLYEGLRYARQSDLPLQTLGGGSNLIFPDSGFDGLVLQIGLKGVEFQNVGADVFVSVAAGETWDDVVKLCVARDLAGIECLSGIPGNTGATPVQNVGAYGQEICETLVDAHYIDRRDLSAGVFTAAQCDFSYRHSRFRSLDRDRYIITRITLRLRQSGAPALRYPELQKLVETKLVANPPAKNTPNQSLLQTVRESVLEIRRRKSMVLDAADPNSRSAGSFFLNPVLSNDELQSFQKRCAALKLTEIPLFPAKNGAKVSAAWLVEKAGDRKSVG